MLEMSNALQREPQQADLNSDVNLLAMRHAQFSFAMWACTGSLVGNQPS